MGRSAADSLSLKSDERELRHVEENCTYKPFACVRCCVRAEHAGCAQAAKRRQSRAGGVRRSAMPGLRARRAAAGASVEGLSHSAGASRLSVAEAQLVEAGGDHGALLRYQVEEDRRRVP